MMLVGFVLHALMQIGAGDPGYRTVKHQPMTYLGALATLGIVCLIGIVGLYYRAKRFLQQRQDLKHPKARANR